MLLHKDSPQICLELTYFIRKLSLIQRFKPRIFYFKPQKQIGQLGSDRQNNSKHLERIYSNLILRDRVRTTVFAPILVDLPGPEPTVVDEAQDVQHVLCRELKVCMFRDFGNWKNDQITCESGSHVLRRDRKIKPVNQMVYGIQDTYEHFSKRSPFKVVSHIRHHVFCY